MQSDVIELSTSEKTYHPQQESLQDTDSSRKLTHKLSSLLISSHILLMPFLFGGVHETTTLIFRALTCVVLIVVLAFDYSAIREQLSLQNFRGQFFVLLCVSFFYCLAHSITNYSMLEPNTAHPIFFDVGTLLRPTVTLMQLTEFFQLISLYVVTTYYLSTDSKLKIEKIINLIIFSSGLVALTALAHWFYDNGKLFWMFSAQHEAASTRARWPFVNPNHLAIFISAAYFLNISRLQVTLANIRSAAASSRHRGNLAISEFIGRKEIQVFIRSLLVQSCFFLIFSLSIIASLSRNAGLNTLLLTITYFLFCSTRNSSRIQPATIPAKSEIEFEQESVDSTGARRVKKIRRSSSNPKSQKLNGINIDSTYSAIRIVFKIALIISILWLIFFFLGERGGDLFKSRVEYALLYTQDDMRWQMYSDSWPMLKDFYLLGIGLANWSSLYPTYTALGLSGMEPSYLHSDILQILIELGLPAFILFSFLVTKWSLKVLSVKQGYFKLLKNGLFFSMLSLILCGFFEFPFRIPAISCLFFMLLAIGAVFSDLSNDNKSD